MKKTLLVGLALSLSILAVPARAGDEGDGKGKDKAGEKKEEAGEKKEEAGDKKDESGDGEGKALGKDVEGENQKHAQRMAKLDRLDAIAKEKNRPELADKVKMLREKENARHERVLARLAKKDEGGKPDDKGGKPDDKGGKPDDKGGKPEDKGAAEAGDGKALGATVEGENAKHAARIAKLDRLDAIATEKSRPELTEKVKMLREKEMKRHERALARLAKTAENKGGPDDKGADKGADNGADKGKGDAKKADAEAKKEEVKQKIADKKAEMEAKKEAMKAKKDDKKDDKKGGKKGN
jgi:hypothetical protein